MKNAKFIVACVIACLIMAAAYSQNATSSSIIQAIQNEEYEAAAQMAKKHGKKINEVDSNLATPLMWAAYTGENLLVEKLLRAGSDVNKTDIQGKTANDYATSNKHYGTALLMNKWQSGYRKKKMAALMDSLTMADELHNATEHFIQLKQYDSALYHLQQEIDLYKLLYGNNHSYYLETIHSKGMLYYSLGDYEKALLVFQENMRIIKKNSGENNNEYANILNEVGTMYELLGEYQQALPLYLQSASIIKELSGDKSLQYAISLANLGRLYQRMGNYDKALPLSIEAIQLKKEISGENTTEYANSINNLANVYELTGAYDKALSLYLQSAAINKKLLGENSAGYATSLNNLAHIYETLGTYDKALPLCQQALQIRKELFGEQHPAYALSMHNLAYLLTLIGSYDKAESLYKKALQIRKEALGEINPEYASTLNNLALLYQSTNAYQQALPLFIRVAEILKTGLGEHHPDYASALNNLATTYQSLGNYDSALALYKQASDIEIEVLGEDHPDHANSLTDIAIVYELMGEPEKALPLYLKVVDINKKSLGENHPVYASSLDNLAGFYFNQKQHEKATALLIQSNKITSDYLLNASKYLSQSDMLHFISKHYPKFDMLNAVAIDTHNKKLWEQCLQTTLQFKGIALQNSKDLSNLLSQNSDTAIAKLSDRLEELKKQLNRSYQHNAPASETDSLNNLFDQTEEKIIREMPEYLHAVENRNISWQKIQQHLKPGEAAIEFIRFNYWNSKWTDSTVYAAFVIEPGKTPLMVRVCAEKKLRQTMLEKHDKNETYARLLYTQPSRGVLLSHTEINYTSLYNLLWKPLDGLLKNTRTIYYSADGLLHRINLPAISIDSKKVLADKYDFHTMSSIANIVSYTPSMYDATQDTLLLFGDISFDRDSSTARIFESNNIVTDTAINHIYWPPLTGTRQEINAISAMSTSKNIPAYTFTKHKASETNFTHFGKQKKSPAFIHIATHGFFFAGDTNRTGSASNYYTAASNAMLRSGIVFAGANQSKQNSNDADDGIVTAYDISNYTLWNTKLMVLSACETGLGDIENSEGVFGLQRAIKIAGCRNLMISLWKVPDEATAQFMEYFYQQLLINNKTVYNSFLTAQKKMRQLYAGKPYYWAGFVLLEY